MVIVRPACCVLARRWCIFAGRSLSPCRRCTQNTLAHAHSSWQSMICTTGPSVSWPQNQKP